ncbi:MAG: AI-2E family transporter [Sphingobacteriales bacterium 40-81]|nr:MAG: AI-2E family transporter [Sphingobacteriales bacterium 40-81]
MRKLVLPFYLKLLSVLLILICLGYIAVIGQTVLEPLLFALLVSTILLPLSKFFENRLNFPRSLACIIAILLFLLSIIFLFIILGSQLSKLSEDWPAFQQQLQDSIHDLQKWISANYGIKYKQQVTYINKAMSDSLGAGTSVLGQTILSISSTLLLFVFTLLYTFFLLYYRTHISIFFVRLFHENYKPVVLEVFRQIQFIVKKYMLGLFIQIVLVSGMAFTAYSLIGIKYAIMLALITGIFNIIPYIGIASSAILTCLITFATAPGSHVLLVIMAIIIIHLIDSNFIMPKVVGSKVQINSLIALLGLVIGELLWGISGMFLSIPVIAIIKIVFDRVQELNVWGYLLGEEDGSTKPKKLKIRLANAKKNKPQQDSNENSTIK